MLPGTSGTSDFDMDYMKPSSSHRFSHERRMSK